MYRKAISESVREFVLERDGYICAYCGGYADCADHIVPYSFCQHNDPDNLVACCRDCNAIVSNKHFDNIAEKRMFIQTKRNKGKWLRKIRNRYSVCTECHKPFKEAEEGATHFICKNCNTPDLEWKERDWRLP